MTGISAAAFSPGHRRAAETVADAAGPGAATPELAHAVHHRLQAHGGRRRAVMAGNKLDTCAGSDAATEFTALSRTCGTRSVSL